jgi:peroxiredoxin Q/BCP
MTQANLAVGQPAPDFTLTDGGGNPWTLSAQRGQTVVMLFYPGDETPVCTRQLCSVRDHWNDYTETGAQVVGLSMNSVAEHKAFTENRKLPLRLLSDKDGVVSKQYGAVSWLPGRSARAVVVIDPAGKISYRKVEALSLFRPKDEEVLAAIRAAGAKKASG